MIFSFVWQVRQPLWSTATVEEEEKTRKRSRAVNHAVFVFITSSESGQEFLTGPTRLRQTAMMGRLLSLNP